MLIDFHTHCFPDALARRAVESLAKNSGLTPCFDGTKDGLLNLMKEQGVDRALALSVATNAHQVRKVNDFAIQIAEGGGPLYAFGSLHPAFEGIKDELLRLKEAGIRGIKMHPDYIATFVDDPSMHPIYAALLELDLCLVIHAGWDYVSPDETFATPERILNAVKRFPGLKLVAAHMGGLRMWEEAERFLVGSDVYLDTSFSLVFMDEELARRMLLRHRPDRLLFGSDAPWGLPGETCARLQKLSLPLDLMQKITHQNALLLLGGRE